MDIIMSKNCVPFDESQNSVNILQLLIAYWLLKVQINNDLRFLQKSETYRQIFLFDFKLVSIF